MAMTPPLDPSLSSSSPDSVPREPLLLALDGFEGPIDLLLSLAHEQKVDLASLSILQLVDQYIAYIAAARALRLEVAADYLVMAAWLAYLKSRLLLPPPPVAEEEKPSAADLAAALAFQLRRLEAMREAGAALFALPRLGVHRYARGMPESTAKLVTRTRYAATLYDFLSAFGAAVKRKENSVFHIPVSRLYSLEEAIKRLERLLGANVVPDWVTLKSFLPIEEEGGLVAKSALASSFVAFLQLAKDGRIDLRQDGPFAPLYLRTANRPPLPEDDQ
jgi:segregation and condensation protein A